MNKELKTRTTEDETKDCSAQSECTLNAIEAVLQLEDMRTSKRLMIISHIVAG